jgi:ABC-type Co2+ transport system permease subunit
VQVVFSTVIGYSMIHVIAFWLVGSAAAALAALVDEVPATLFLVVIFFAIFEVGFYILVATVAQSLLGALAWVNVAIGNGLAAVGMGYYLWRVHPHIREALAAHPLGETEDGD